MKDHSFDAQVEHFKSNIYQSRKGRLRLALQQECLLQQIPALKMGSMRIAELGGGQGQMAAWFAQMGHHVWLNDLSANMIDMARQQWSHQQDWQLSYHVGAIQEIDESMNGQFDLVCVNAVLEWSQDPVSILSRANHLLAKDGKLVVMFFNKHSITLRNLMMGNFYAAKQSDYRGDGRGLTPINPIDPQWLFEQMTQLGLQINHQRGIRCFSDYVYPTRAKVIDEADFLALERQYCEQAPYKDMARYIHLICSRAASGQ